MVGGGRGGPPWRRLHRLPVDDRGAGRGLPAEPHAQQLAQARMQRLPRPLHAPLPDIILDRLVWWEVVGQLAPGAATAHDGADGIDDLAPRPACRPSAGLDGGHQRLQDRPLLVAQIRRKAFALPARSPSRRGPPTQSPLAAHAVVALSLPLSRHPLSPFGTQPPQLVVAAVASDAVGQPRLTAAERERLQRAKARFPSLRNQARVSGASVAALMP